MGGNIMNVIQGKIDCKPIETGFDESRIEMLNKRLGEMIDRRLIHGVSYCISHKGKVIAHGALGRNNGMGLDMPMQPDTVFGIASITKTFTATAIMQLVEDGYIRLSTPVGEILPQFAEKPFDGITLLQLLTHTSGLYPDGGCFPEAASRRLLPRTHGSLSRLPQKNGTERASLTGYPQGFPEDFVVLRAPSGSIHPSALRFWARS